MQGNHGFSFPEGTVFNPASSSATKPKRNGKWPTTENALPGTKAVATGRPAKALIFLTSDDNTSVYDRGSRFGLIHDVPGVAPADDAIYVSLHGQQSDMNTLPESTPMSSA